MPITYTQTDAATDCGPMQACSGATVDGDEVETELIEGGTAGGTEQTASVPAGTSELVCFMQTTGGVGPTTWDAGTYTVRINVTNAQMDVAVTGVWVCRVDDTCTSVASVASDTSLNADISAGGVFSWSIAGTEQTASSSDDLYILIEATNSHSMASRSVGITPDQDIDTPITVDPPAAPTNLTADFA